ncbi:Transcriptional regulatory protein DegU [compost metagenome]|jgi:DNA-binding NarL/FixJ family response regulator
MKILIADDHALVVSAVQAKLAQLDAEIEFRCASCIDELFKVAGDDLDLALVDLAMPGAQGYAHIAQLRRQFPALPLIVLSGSDDVQVMRAVLDLGALGFIPKAYSADVLLSAVRLVLVGGIYIPPMLLGAPGTYSNAIAMPGNSHSHSDTPSLETLSELLTERQVDVLRLLSQGKPNKLIARELGISEGTVKIHLAAVFRALNVRNRTEAVVTASSLEGI